MWQPGKKNIHMIKFSTVTHEEPKPTGFTELIYLFSFANENITRTLKPEKEANCCMVHFKDHLIWEPSYSPRILCLITRIKLTHDVISYSVN